MDSNIHANIDSGLIDIKIINNVSDAYLGEILTLLPKTFHLSKGQNLKIKEKEILYEQGYNN